MTLRIAPVFRTIFGGKDYASPIGGGFSNGVYLVDHSFGIALVSTICIAHYEVRLKRYRGVKTFSLIYCFNVQQRSVFICYFCSINIQIISNFVQKCEQ